MFIESSVLSIGDYYTVSLLKSLGHEGFFQAVPTEDPYICGTTIGTEEEIEQGRHHRKRLRQIGNADCLEGFDRQLLAATIDTCVKRVLPVAPDCRGLMLKKRPEYSGMKMSKGRVASRSVLFDCSLNLCSVPTKNYSLYKNHGTYKRVRALLTVPFLSFIPVSALMIKGNTTLKDPKTGAFDIQTMEGDRDDYLTEIKLQKRFSCFPKIHMAIFTSSTRFEVRGNVEGSEGEEKAMPVSLPKVKVIEDIYQRIGERQVSRMPNKMLLPIMSDLVRGLETLHRAGIVHWDIKVSNALFRNMGRIEGKWIDLSLAFSPSIPSTWNFLVKQGYYGTIFCTPPEVFGKRPFCEDFYAAEVFALSIMFYNILYCRSIPWGKMLHDAYDSQSPPTAAEQAKLETDIQKFIEEEMKKLPAFKDRLGAEMSKLTLEMMSPNPTQRPTLPSIAERLQLLEKA